ncbi:unnamed protein product, partial [Mycena citricolor]
SPVGAFHTSGGGSGSSTRAVCLALCVCFHPPADTSLQRSLCAATGSLRVVWHSATYPSTRTLGFQTLRRAMHSVLTYNLPHLPCSTLRGRFSSGPIVPDPEETKRNATNLSARVLRMRNPRK